MRLQGSQTRLGGDISRVKRESAGDGRKRKSVGRLARAQAKQAEEGSDNAAAASSVRACVRACACERAALVAHAVEAAAARNEKRQALSRRKL